MYFKNISLRNFRNFESLNLNLSKKLNIFIGKNGQGKTNLIEALDLLSSGESFRYGENSDLIKKNEDKSFIKTNIIEHDLEYEITLEITKSKKNFLLNNKKTSIANLHSKFPIVIFSPESLSIIKEASDERRALVDQLLISVHPRYAQLISDYKKILKTRNKVLKNFKDKITNEKMTYDLLDSLELNFLKIGTELTRARIFALKEILPDLNFNFQNISHLQKNVEILVDYVISGECAMTFSEEKIYNTLQNRLRELEKIELSTGASLVGPHKHEIRFLYNGNDSRFFCSQGQQRALILSFKMAQIVYHRKVHKTEPVLLLDDVLSELDPEKRSCLISFLNEINSQIFITTTDLSLPEKMKTHMNSKYTEFEVEDGKIEERSSV